MTYPLTFDTLYAQYRRKVLSLAARHVGRQDAEDLAQVVWIKVYRFWHTFRRDANPGTWLFAIVRNAACDYVRAKRCKTWNLSTELEVAFTIHDRTQGVEDALLHKDRVRQAKNRLKRLPPIDRRAAVLVLTRSVAEAASVQDIPIGTAKSRGYRAIAQARLAS